MHRFFGAVIALPCLLVLDQVPQADFTSVNRFWSIATTLTTDAEPDSAAWVNLLNSPAYRALAQDNRIKRLFRVAFRPSARGQRDSIVASGTYDGRQVRHLIRALEQRASLQRFRDSLASVNLVEQGTALAATYLPAGETARRAPPAIAFGIFEPAAYGARDGITVDLLFALDRGPAFVRILGHEVHHVHTGFLSGLHLPERSAPEYQLLQSLRNLANEGTADRINLVFPVGPPAVSAEVSPAYNDGYNKAGSTLRGLDSLWSGIQGDSARLRQAGQETMQRLVYGGHPVGAYMAQRIEETLGREALIATVGNPFAFLARYDDTEQRLTGRPLFSAPTKRLIKDLEHRFLDTTPRN